MTTLHGISGSAQDQAIHSLVIKVLLLRSSGESENRLPEILQVPDENLKEILALPNRAEEERKVHRIGGHHQTSNSRIL
jgi:hypothetical protein